MTAIFSVLSHYMVTMGTISFDFILIGSSGANFGLMGAQAAFMIIFWHKMKPDLRRNRTIWIIICTLLLQIFGMVSAESNVAFASHIGGFISGFLLFWGATKLPKMGNIDELNRGICGISSVFIRAIFLSVFALIFVGMLIIQFLLLMTLK